LWMKEGWLRRVLPAKDRGETVSEIPVDAVVFNPYQPRRSFGEEELRELAGSIREYGVIQPIVVRPYGKGFELIAGERRLRAAKLAGLETIPAIVREASDRDTALLALVENLQREDLSFLDEAEGYQRLLEEFGLTQEELARRVGKSQSTIANKLRLLRLPESVRRAIREGGISERHARALLRLDEEEVQLAVVERVVEEDMTVREAEELVASIAAGPSGREGGSGARRERVTAVFKDIRIFLNSFRQAVAALRKAGIAAEMTQADVGDALEIRVRIPKAGGGG